jgi:hypothetical protein
MAIKVNHMKIAIDGTLAYFLGKSRVKPAKPAVEANQKKELFTLL